MKTTQELHEYEWHQDLSRDVWAFLLCFTLSAAAEGGLQSGLSTSHHDYWAVEDAKEREKLPLYRVLPAAKPDELTPPPFRLNRHSSFRSPHDAHHKTCPGWARS